MRRLLALPAVLATFATLAACEPAGRDLSEVLPDERLLVDFGTAAARARVGDPSEHAAMTSEAAAEIDQLLSDVIAMLDEVTSFPASWDSGSRTQTWGPWEDDGLNGRLWVRENGDGGYGWALEIKPVEAPTSAFVAVAHGHVSDGASLETSDGDFAIDFDAAAGAGGGDGEVGDVRVEYELVHDGAIGTIRFRDFAEDAADPEADAIVSYDVGALGGSIDWVVRGDTSDPPNGVEERVVIRSRWDDTGAGRLDARITGGDLGVLTFEESGCWDAAGAEIWFRNSYELVEEGDPADCAFADPSFAE